VGLRRGEEEIHLVEALALSERPIEPALVRDQHGVRNPGTTLIGREHLLGVGELGDDVRTHERRELDPSQTRLAEHVDQPDLLLGRDHLGLVLKAVTRPDLADPNALGKRGSPREVMRRATAARVPRAAGKTCESHLGGAIRGRAASRNLSPLRPGASTAPGTPQPTR
jgi:hypothetical protein